MANQGRPKKNLDGISEIGINNENKNIDASLNNPSSSNPSKNEKQILAAFASVNEFQQQYFTLTNPNGMKTLADLVVPIEYREQIKKAKELRNSDLVDKLLKIRQDYFARIKGFKCKNKTQEKFYNDNVLPLVKRFARQYEYELYSLSEVFPHYGFKKDKRTLMFLRSENGESIIPTEAFGYEMFEVRISQKLRDYIKKLQTKGMIDKLPEYLTKAINGKGIVSDTIVLDKENMYRSCLQKPDYETRPVPNLLKIMKSITLREFLIDLDFVNAFASLKTSIVHIKGGTKEHPWNSDKVEKLHTLITNRAPGQCFISTAGDVEISPVNINLTELFDPKRFEECNKRILDFMGIPIVFVPTQAGEINNQSVIVSIKPFEESIKSDRKIFQEFIDVLCEEINDRNGFTKIPELEFEHTNIRDDAVLIKELQFLKDSGILSFEDTCVEFDFDKDEVMEKKKYDWENRDIQAPVIELSQGTSPLLQKKFEQELELKKAAKPIVSTKNNSNNKVGENKNVKTKEKSKEKEKSRDSDSE